MLHTVEFGNHETGYFFLQILKSGYAKCMLINKGGYDTTIWAARPRHPLVQVTPGGSALNAIGSPFSQNRPILNILFLGQKVRLLAFLFPKNSPNFIIFYLWAKK